VGGWLTATGVGRALGGRGGALTEGATEAPAGVDAVGPTGEGAASSVTAAVPVGVSSAVDAAVEAAVDVVVDAADVEELEGCGPAAGLLVPGRSNTTTATTKAAATRSAAATSVRRRRDGESPSVPGVPRTNASVLPAPAGGGTAGTATGLRSAARNR
jgi:hypothetical protein